MTDNTKYTPSSGLEDIQLAKGEAVAACSCTGCLACLACIACTACIACVACIFPPLLAPVTATAAGSCDRGCDRRLSGDISRRREQSAGKVTEAVDIKEE